MYNRLFRRGMARKNYMFEKSKYDNIKDSRDTFIGGLKDIIDSKSSSAEEVSEAQSLIKAIEEDFTEANLEEMEMVKSYKSHYADREKALKPSLDELPKKLAEKFGIVEDTFMTVSNTQRKLGVLLSRVDKVVSQDDIYKQVKDILTDPKLDKSDKILGECAAAFNTFFTSIAEKLSNSGYIKDRVGDNETTWRATYYEQDGEGNMSKFVGKNKYKEDKAKQVEKGLATRRKNKNESYYYGEYVQLNEGVMDILSTIGNKVSGFFKSICSKLFSDTAEEKIDDLADALSYRAAALKSAYNRIYALVEDDI